MEKKPQKLVPTSSVTLNFANLKKYVNPQAKTAAGFSRER